MTETSMESTGLRTSEQPQQRDISPWRVSGWVCAGVIILSVIACVIIAAARSTALTRVTVRALNPEAEPRDHNLPLVKQNEALPDYELTVMLTNGEKHRLGAKPDTSAANGLTWQLSNPVSVADVATIRLQERDQIISDAVAEVQIAGDSVVDHNYEFKFSTERSINAGVSSFFATPIGKAIAAGFCIAIILILVGLLNG